jgi:hypothetical protein
MSGFHHIIFATQATRAVPILSTYLDSLVQGSGDHNLVSRQLNCIKAFEYRYAIIVNHTDPTLIPNEEIDRREINIMCIKDQEHSEKAHSTAAVTQQQVCHSDIVPPSYTMATQILNRPPGIPEDLAQIYQTTNPLISPAKDTILSSSTLERAIVTVKSKEALNGLYEEKKSGWLPRCAGQGTSKLGWLQGAGRLDGATESPGIWFCGAYAYAGIPMLEGCVVSARNVVEQGICQSEGVNKGYDLW